MKIELSFVVRHEIEIDLDGGVTKAINSEADKLKNILTAAGFQADINFLGVGKSKGNG